MSERYRHLDKVRTEFERIFGSQPTLVARAPARVNLIGEHTDYNDGWVLPAAIPFEVDVAARPRGDDQVRLAALDLGRQASFSLPDRVRSEELWLRYPQGVAVQLQEEGHILRGMDAAYTGDVPASGLSSSAAVEVAFARAYALASGLDLSAAELALVSHRAENSWVGVPSGVMDQFVSAVGKEDHAVLLDCRTLEYRHVPISLPGVAIVVMDTGVRRQLSSSEYPKRRAGCETAVERLQGALPAIRALRDVSPEDLETHANLLDGRLLRRARHVVNENARTLEAAQALEAGDARRMGELMRASHESLRDLYEVSSPELNAIVEIAWDTEGVIGARMTGAGFGGAAVALVEEGAVESLKQRLASEYPRRTGKEARVWVCTAAAGAEATWL